MIDIYGILAIPLAAFYSYAFSKKMVFKILLLLLLVFFIYLNKYQTWQYRQSIVHYDSMTKKAYWNSLFKEYVTVEYWNEYLQPPDYYGAVTGKNR